jgi:hypothetical protein
VIVLVVADDVLFLEMSSTLYTFSSPLAILPTLDNFSILSITTVTGNLTLGILVPSY